MEARDARLLMKVGWRARAGVRYRMNKKRETNLQTTVRILDIWQSILKGATRERDYPCYLSPAYENLLDTKYNAPQRP